MAERAGTDARDRFWQGLGRNWMGMVGLAMLVVALATAIFAPWIAPYNPKQPVRVTIDTIYAPPKLKPK